MPDQEKEKKIKNLLEQQRDFFQQGETRQHSRRREFLLRLKLGLQEREEDILSALETDLGKHPVETYAAELGIIKQEINYVLKRLKKWMKPRKSRLSFLHFWSRGAVHTEPYGNVLIISPWNYPLQLALLPLVDALAAGNCVLLKPSEHSPATSLAIEEIVSDYLPSELVAAVQGAKETGKFLLEQQYDFIFFTGNKQVGRIVMKKAAENLIPVSLELGGKCPCLVDETARLDLAARRIVWGKLLNAGQTCVAPDYVLVHHQQKEAFLERAREAVSKYYGSNPAESPDYPRIINENHFQRIKNYLDNTKGRIVLGGETDLENLYIAPTIIDDITPSDALMQEEIFGPLLPVLEYEDISRAREIIDSFTTPLSFYLFTRDSRLKKQLIQEIPFGSGCINDTLIQASTPRFPFGGKAESGMGAYHGRAGFNLFSHHKTVIEKTDLFDIKLRYPPYQGKLKLLKRLFRWF